MNKEKCPLCADGYMTSDVELTRVTYRGVDGLIPCTYHLCDSCNSDLATVSDVKINKSKMVEFKKDIDIELTT